MRDKSRRRLMETECQQLVAHFAALSEAIVKEDRLEAILQAYNHHLAAILPFDESSISVVQNETHTTWHLIRGCPEAQIEKKTGRLRGSLVHRVMSTQQPVILADIDQEDSADPEVQEIKRRGTRSIVISPLIFGDRVVGAMDIESHEAGAFNEDDLPIIKLIANQIALALDKGQVLREQELKIEAVGEQLVRAGRMATVGQLAAVLAHELKNRFNVIQLGVQSLADILPEQDSDVRLLLGNVQNAIKQGQALMQDLLRYAKPQAPNPEPVNFKTLTEDTLSIIRRPDVRVVVNWEKPIPPVFGNEAQLGQVLVNLVINALDAMPGGGTLAVVGSWEVNQVVVRITDTGCGMSDEVKRHLFEPFFTTKKQGTGLGLSVSRTIVEQSGGQLAIESQEGKGTTVTLRFPISEQQAA